MHTGPAVASCGCKFLLKDTVTTMASKGVDYYFNVSGTAGAIQATDFSGAFPSKSAFQTGNVQINYQLSLSIYGSFNWSSKTTPVVSGNVTINPITGNTGSGNLTNMMSTPSVLAPGFAVSFGFYDSGPGCGGLTNQDQVYAYLTPSMSGWMGQLASQYPQVKTAPFCQFALPGAHDAGTFDLTAVRALLADAQAVAAFLALIGGELTSVVASQALTAITNLAVTQKDDILTMLNLGCRYFDFRPGYTPSEISSFATGIYHEHSVIPGYPFLSFLTDVLQWLKQSSSEIVVVSANNQGFYQAGMTPSDEVLAGILTQAQQATKSTIVVGTAADLNTSYGDLIAANKRLIFLNQIGGWYPAAKYDSYSGAAYSTTNPQSIIGALNKLTEAGAKGSNYTVLQLQGTATSVNTEVVICAAASLSHASSPLMSTKALFDSHTYPWLSTNVVANLSNQYLVVFLNDFVDNVLAQTAMEITKQRMGIG
jgi:hypothetical protein